MELQPFSPLIGTTAGKTVKVTGTASSVASSITLTNAISGNTVIVTNAGSVLGFVRMSGEATPVATAADIPVLPGSQSTFTIPVDNATVGVAVISSTSASIDVYFTPGNGV